LSALHATDECLHHPERASAATTFETYLYMSGITFFTVGYGDVVPTSSSGHLVAVIEAGIGLAMLALVVGYLPVIYQAFSRREVTISLLDAHAGRHPARASCSYAIAKILKS